VPSVEGVGMKVVVFFFGNGCYLMGLIWRTGSRSILLL